MVDCNLKVLYNLNMKTHTFIRIWQETKDDIDFIRRRSNEPVVKLVHRLVRRERRRLERREEKGREVQ